VALFNPIVQILTLANLVFVAAFLLKHLDSCGIGTALIDRDFIRQTMLTDGFLEKAQSSLLVSTGMGGGRVVGLGHSGLRIQLLALPTGPGTGLSWANQTV
jgi:hypothetical protein